MPIYARCEIGADLRHVTMTNDWIMIGVLFDLITTRERFALRKEEGLSDYIKRLFEEAKLSLFF